MQIKSKIDAVTLFTRGAEITRLAKIELVAGEHVLVVNDLPIGILQNSLRVEGRADGSLELGAVDCRTVHVSKSDTELDAIERTKLERELLALEDEARETDARRDTADTQKKLMDNLATMPLNQSPHGGGDTDWGAVFDLIGDRLPIAHGVINALVAERRDLQKRIDELRTRLADEPVAPELRMEVKIETVADADLTGELTIRYQMHDSGWEPLYDARLVTGGEEQEPLIELTRRAAIYQNSEEAWENVALTLSTTRPTGGTSAPELYAQVLDILPDHPPMAQMQRSMKNKTMMVAGAAMATDEVAEAMPQEMMRGAVEREAPVEHSSFQATYKVPGLVDLPGRGVDKKVHLGSETLKPRLQVRATPLLDPTAYLHADFELEGDLALLPGQVALYRDNVYVGDGCLPLINVGEHFELGFGVDDMVSIKRVELQRSKGKHGLIKSENTDEFHYRIIINNHHADEMPVRILDRIPASNHEKLKIELLKEMSEATMTNIDDRRGVLAFEYDLSEGAEQVINIHYRLSWPMDMQIG